MNGRCIGSLLGGIVLLNSSGCTGWFNDVPYAKTPPPPPPSGAPAPPPWGMPDYGTADGLTTTPNMQTALGFCAEQRAAARTQVKVNEGFGIGLGVLGLAGTGTLTGAVAAASGSKAPGLTTAQGAGYAGGIAAFGTLTAIGVYILARASSARNAYWRTNGAIAAMYGNTGESQNTQGGQGGGHVDPNPLLKAQQDWQQCSTAITAIAASDAQVDTSVIAALKPGASPGGGGGSPSTPPAGLGVTPLMAPRVEQVEPDSLPAPPPGTPTGAIPPITACRARCVWLYAQRSAACGVGDTACLSNSNKELADNNAKCEDNKVKPATVCVLPRTR